MTSVCLILRGDLMHRLHGRGVVAVVLFCASSGLRAQDRAADFQAPDDVVVRAADILSEGTRMAAEVFAPKKPKTEKLPTIIMSHGWGGTAAALRADALVFAKAGYLVIAFDYRGWGNSDARLILAGKKPQTKTASWSRRSRRFARWSIRSTRRRTL